VQPALDSSAALLFDKHFFFMCVSWGHAALQLNEVPRYKPEGRGCDSSPLRASYTGKVVRGVNNLRVESERHHWTHCEPPYVHGLPTEISYIRHYAMGMACVAPPGPHETMQKLNIVSTECC